MERMPKIKSIVASRDVFSTICQGVPRRRYYGAMIYYLLEMIEWF
jgi:hypothetical protein